MTEFNFDNINFIDKIKYSLKSKGKVRNIYDIEHTNKILLEATNRTSAFDYNICEIETKGIVLTELSAYWFNKLSHITNNHYINHYKNYMLVKKCKPIKLEFIVRGYITGSCWKKYNKGDRTFCGVELPDGLIENQQFEKPIITPTTKGEHDYPITKNGIVSEKYLTEQQISFIYEVCMSLYLSGSKEFMKKGLILVDTKYEFGFNVDDGTIMLIDEIHTPDCSRIWNKESYDNHINDNNNDIMNMDKDILRHYLNSISFTDNINEHIKKGYLVDSYQMPIIPTEIIENFKTTYNNINDMFNNNDANNNTNKHKQLYLQNYDQYNAYKTISNNKIKIHGQKYVENMKYLNLFSHNLINCDENFVMIISGSTSDEEHCKKILYSLLKHNIIGGCCYISAHKNTQKTIDYINYINKNYNKVIWITVAGMSNALSGVVAANTKFPVIACPPFKDNIDMMVNIQSTLQMPSNVPVMTVINIDNAVLACKRIFNINNF